MNHASSLSSVTVPGPVLGEMATERDPLADERVAASYRLDSFHDVAISELTAEARQRINEAAGDDWFRSASFAATYSVPQAERVCFLTDRRGKVVDACFYREARRWKLVPEIHLLGRTVPASLVVRHLIGAQRPALIHLPWFKVTEMETVKALNPICSAQPLAEDFVIELPSSSDLYLQSLGSKTRKHLPYYVRRMQREWGVDLELVPLCGPEVPHELYEELLDLNRQRMRHRRRESGWRPLIVEQRWPIVEERGLLYGVYHRKKLAAGTLSFVQGRDAYLIVVAHDPAFDALNLGSVALWLTLKHLIAAEFRRFHLMWGASAYKTQFGGKIEQLFSVTRFSSSILATAWRAQNALHIRALTDLAGKSARRLVWEIGQIGRTR